MCVLHNGSDIPLTVSQETSASAWRDGGTPLRHNRRNRHSLVRVDTQNFAENPDHCEAQRKSRFLGHGFQSDDSGKQFLMRVQPTPQYFTSFSLIVFAVYYPFYQDVRHTGN